MNFDGFEMITSVELDSSFRFSHVDLELMKVELFQNDDCSEVRLYSADLKLLRSVRSFFSMYLKALYIELFDGEAKEELIDAYDNIVSSYEIKFSPLSKDELRSQVSVFSGGGCGKLHQYIDVADYAFREEKEQLIYLFVSKGRLCLVECDYE